MRLLVPLLMLLVMVTSSSAKRTAGSTAKAFLRSKLAGSVSREFLSFGIDAGWAKKNWSGLDFR